MTRNKTILLAFAGQEIDQVEGVSEIGDGYECLNLRKFHLEEFIEELQAKIPPVSENVLRNYKAEDERGEVAALRCGRTLHEVAKI